MGEHDRSGIDRFGFVEGAVQISEELARQCVAVVLGVERDGGDSIHHDTVDHPGVVFGSGHGGRR